MRAARAARGQSTAEGNEMRGLMYGGEQHSAPTTANPRFGAVRNLSHVDSTQLPRTARHGGPPRTSGGRSKRTRKAYDAPAPLTTVHSVTHSR